MTMITNGCDGNHMLQKMIRAIWTSEHSRSESSWRVTVGLSGPTNFSSSGFAADGLCSLLHDV